MNSFIDGSAFCPGAPKRVPTDSEEHLHVYTSSHVCHSHEWRVDMATGKTLKKRNACWDVRISAVENKIAASEAKGLIKYTMEFKYTAYSTVTLVFSRTPKM